MWSVLGLLLTVLASREGRQLLFALLPIFQNLVQAFRQKQLDAQATKDVLDQLSARVNEWALAAIAARAGAPVDAAGVRSDPENLGAGPGEG